jgi:hypothetical protein
MISEPLRLLGVGVGLQKSLGDERIGGDSATRGHFVGTLQTLQSVDGGASDVDGIRGAERLGEHVVDSGFFEDDASGTTGDDAGTGRGRLQHDATGSEDADDRVSDGGAGHRNREHVALGVLGALLDGQGNFLGLAVAQAHATVAIANHDERGEREATTALDDLGHAVDVNDARLTTTIGGVALAGAGTITLARVARATITLTGVRIVRVVRHQNSSPASRAASATAATRPWYR